MIIKVLRHSNLNTPQVITSLSVHAFFLHNFVLYCYLLSFLICTFKFSASDYIAILEYAISVKYSRCVRILISTLPTCYILFA